MAFHIVCNLYRFVGGDIVVPSEPQFAQCIAAVIAAVHREYQPAVIAKGSVIYHIGDFRILRILFCIILICLHSSFCSFEICVRFSAVHICAAPCQENDYANQCRNKNICSQSRHLPF